MFALFYSLYYSMFIGNWNSFSVGQIVGQMQPVMKELGTFFTSIFGDVQMTDLGTSLFAFGQTTYGWITLVAFVLALITSIGIVLMAVKGIKRAFGIFFMGIRR